MENQSLIILLSLLFSAFFSGMEIAYISANKVYIEIEKKQKSFISTLLNKLTSKPSKFIASMLIGNNIALVIYGLIMGEVIITFFESLLPVQNTVINFFISDAKILSQTLISTFIILFTAEFFPKVFFQIYANKLIRFLALPAYLFYQLFHPLALFVMWISDVLLIKFFNIEGDKIQLSFTKVELGDYITEQMEDISEEDEVDSEIQFFQNALEFSEVKAREAMVPRNEVVAVEVKEKIANVIQLFTQTGYSKILVYKENKDNIIGYVHSFDMFKRPKKIKEILIPVVFVPETLLIKDALNTLIRKKKSISVVIDEYGGTSGIMTVEDIVEELFGEIEDEHDPVMLTEKKISEQHYLFSARLEVDYINEKYKIDLPESDQYETLSGLIVHHSEDILEKDDYIKIGDLHFKVKEASNRRLNLVELKIKKD
ncbi:hemolysin family protein [Psychroflexus maritimus]|uniref:HlyC/CorC family transporter n=1 Tax=Psychroflexus maritimus TaxID=2714865 RepID=A0A967E3C2_9FLAO|nr:hemolysin family protein [Psychroflexus maritimus]NGZ90559.1 HlyC/CorC family transporter [Psychroflexus maritimus]